MIEARFAQHDLRRECGAIEKGDLMHAHVLV
jgi:hypothetical protein